MRSENWLGGKMLHEIADSVIYDENKSKNRSYSSSVT